MSRLKITYDGHTHFDGEVQRVSIEHSLDGKLELSAAFTPREPDFTGKTGDLLVELYDAFKEAFSLL